MKNLINTLTEKLLKDKTISSLKYINEIKVDKPVNLEEAIKSLTEYMINQGMDIKPLPKLKMINNDSKNASNILGKTAYYNPNDCSITLYTMNRLPKDILRSYAHEMIHRMQDNEGRLQNIHTTNTNEGGELGELEKEAYLKGNMCLRNWEDKIKNNISIDENEEPTFGSTKVENEWELKILNDLTAEKLKEMLLNPKYSEGSFVIQGEGLKDILQQTFGFPNTPSNIKKNEELFKTKTKYLYSDMSNKVGKFKPSQLDVIRDKDGKLLFMFLKNNKDNQTLVKDYYEQISKKTSQSDLNPEIVNPTTIRFPLSDTANLNKILDNLKKEEILTNEDYTLKKQPKL